MTSNLSDTTTLMPNQAALCWDPDDGFTIKIPTMEDDDKVPPEMVLLITLLMRINNDQSFVDDQVAWMDERAKSLDEGKEN